MVTVGTFFVGLFIFVLCVAGFVAFVAFRDKRRAATRVEAPHVSRTDEVASLPPRSSFSAFELRQQRTYRVKVRFLDYDKQVHEVGERWRFLGQAFLPYEDGLSLFVERDDRQVHIRLQCREGEQRDLVQKFSDFVVEE